MGEKCKRGVEGGECTAKSGCATKSDLCCGGHGCKLDGVSRVGNAEELQPWYEEIVAPDFCGRANIWVRSANEVWRVGSAQPRMAVLPKAICAAAATVAKRVVRGKCLGYPAFVGLIALTARAPDDPSYRRFSGRETQSQREELRRSQWREWRSRVAGSGFTPCGYGAAKNRTKSAGRSACATKATRVYEEWCGGWGVHSQEWLCYQKRSVLRQGGRQGYNRRVVSKSNLSHLDRRHNGCGTLLGACAIECTEEENRWHFGRKLFSGLPLSDFSLVPHS